MKIACHLAWLFGFLICAVGPAPPCAALIRQFVPAAKERARAVERAGALYEESVTLARQEEYTPSRAKLLEAVEIWRGENQMRRAAAALLDSADRAKDAGRIQDSLHYYLLALRSDTLTEQARTQADASIAWIYFVLNHFDLSLRYYERALEGSARLKDGPSQALMLTGMAAVYAEMGSVERSRECLSRANAIRCDNTTHEARAKTVWLAGHIYQRLGNHAAARSALENALALYDGSSGHQEERVLMMCDLSGILLSLSENNEALENAKSACKLIEAYRLSESRWRGYLALARAQAAVGNKLVAQTSYYRSIADVERLGAGVSADSLKIGFFEQRQAPYRELVNLLVEQGRYDEAFKLVEHARSRAMLDLLARNRRDAGSSRVDSEVTAITADVARLHKELHVLQAGSGVHDAIEVALDNAGSRREELRIEAQLGRVYRFTKPANLNQIQESALGPAEMLVEFFLGSERSYIWAVSRDSVACRILPPKAIIERRIESYIRTLGTRPSYLHLERELQVQRKEGSDLARFLFSDVLDMLAPGVSLIVVPDGSLWYLPFETLLASAHGRFLIQDHAICYFPSASILALYRSSQPAPAPSDRLDLLAFGDPVPQKHAGKSRNAGPGSASLVAGLSFNPLPGSRDEVLSASHCFPSDRTRVFLGSDATLRAFKRETAGHFKFIHLATHSVPDTVHPSRSAILFCPESSADNGLMEMGDVTELDLTGCELVVLSACQTGRGRLISGEGLVGMARAFLCSGARSVAVSLWDVTDLSTTNLIKSFYKRLCHGAASRDALRLAKLEMIETRSASHPFYWASFVLVGSSS
jgi:CHAT domain-containing protein